MVASAANRPATHRDLATLPDHVVGEILSGELHVSPRPASKHAFTSSIIGHDLLGPFGRKRDGDGPGGWWILDEPELHFGDDVVVPDLAGWRRERLPEVPDVAYFELAPDWVCEVLSPSTARLDRVKKLPVYARAKVGHLWLVEPVARTVEVYRASEQGWILVETHGDDERARMEPFDAVELALAQWWA